MSATKSVPVSPSLDKCTCNPVVTRRPDADRPGEPQEWVIRCNLKGPDGSILPLFVTVWRRRGRLSANIESDQTDFRADTSFRIKRASISNLKFWLLDNKGE